MSGLALPIEQSEFEQLMTLFKQHIPSDVIDVGSAEGVRTSAKKQHERGAPT